MVWLLCCLKCRLSLLLTVDTLLLLGCLLCLVVLGLLDAELLIEPVVIDGQLEVGA